MQDENNTENKFAKTIAGLILVLSRVIPEVFVQYIIPAILFIYLWNIPVVRLFGGAPINFMESLAFVWFGKFMTNVLFKGK